MVTKKRNITILFLFIILSILPLFFTHIGKATIYRGDDIYFHLGRIEGLYEGIRNYDFIPKINYFFLSGLGYGSPMFYSDLFLYPAALFRLLGLSINQAYILFLFTINLITYIISYRSFLFYKNSYIKALIFSILYGSAGYRLSDLTERAALGELLALTFLPIALVGILSIINKKRPTCIPLAIGMSCLILSHLLSAFIFSLFILLYIIINSKLLVKERFRIVCLLKSIGLTILLCLGFLLPLFEQLNSQKFYFQVQPVTKLSQNADSLKNYFSYAIKNSSFNNVGILTIILCILLIVNYKKLSKTSIQLLCLGGLFFLFATNLIPYHLLDNSIFNMIQFPWRFFSIVILCICWAFSDSLHVIFIKKKTERMLIYVTLLISSLLIVLHGMFIASPERYASRDEINHIPPFFLGWGQEYLPEDMNLQLLFEQPSLLRQSNEISIENVEYSYGSMVFDIQSKNNSLSNHIIAPYTFYKGYQLVIDDHIYSAYKSDKMAGLSEFKFPMTENKKVKAKIYYHWTIIQLTSFIISVSTLIILLIFKRYPKLTLSISNRNKKKK